MLETRVSPTTMGTFADTMSQTGMRTLTVSRMRGCIVAVAVAALFAAAGASAKESPFAGHWRINLEETDKVTETFEEGSGAGRTKLLQNTRVSVSGLPLPSLGGRIPPQSSMSPKNPDVLLCTTLSIDMKSERDIELSYDAGNKTEKLKRGHYRGRDTEWSKRRIQQKYKTPDRKVTKTWTIRPDGRLLVAVKLNPPKDKSRTFKRVFDRIDEAELSIPPAPFEPVSEDQGEAETESADKNGTEKEAAEKESPDSDR